MKTPSTVSGRGGSHLVLERREVEKRIYGGCKESAHGFRNLSVIKIFDGFEHPITELETKFDKIMNKINSLRQTPASP